jgi:hypothetical protein
MPFLYEGISPHQDRFQEAINSLLTRTSWPGLKLWLRRQRAAALQDLADVRAGRGVAQASGSAVVLYRLRHRHALEILRRVTSEFGIDPRFGSVEAFLRREKTASTPNNQQLIFFKRHNFPGVERIRFGRKGLFGEVSHAAGSAARG